MISSTELVTQLSDLCVMAGLCYDLTPPVQVSPGVFTFYATQLHDSCRKRGECREQMFYAMYKEGRLVLV